MYMYMFVPCEELGNGLGAEDGGHVAIGDAADIGLYVLVLDDRHEFLE